MVVLVDCIVAVGSTVLDSGHLLVSTRAGSGIVASSAIVCLYRNLVDWYCVVTLAYGRRLCAVTYCHAFGTGQVHAEVSASGWYPPSVGNPYASVSDRAHDEAFGHDPSLNPAVRFYVLATGQVHAEASSFDQNAEESPSPAWAVGKVVVPY